MKFLAPLLSLVALLFFSSCASYVTPGGPADLSGITDRDIAESFKKRPAAKYPANIALVRVQQKGYRSYSSEGRGHGAFSVVTNPEAESDEAIERLKSLPKVRGVARLNSLLIPTRLNSGEDIRRAAAKLQTDHVLLYTVDTKFRDRDVFKPLSAISLGLTPTQTFKVTSTVSALLLDTRTGYVHGTLEEQYAESGLATGWGKRDAIDAKRVKTEKQAVDKAIESFGDLWPRLPK